MTGFYYDETSDAIMLTVGMVQDNPSIKPGWIGRSTLTTAEQDDVRYQGHA